MGYVIIDLLGSLIFNLGKNSIYEMPKIDLILTADSLLTKQV